MDKRLDSTRNAKGGNELEESIRAGRGRPNHHPNPSCRRCGGSGGYMDEGLNKVYCDCRYQQGTRWSITRGSIEFLNIHPKA